MALHPQSQQHPPRTPSPTPSEKEELERGIVNWKKVFRWQTWFQKKYIPWYIGLIIISVLVTLMTLYHKEIVEWLKPVANWMHSFPVGWLIPIIVLFVLSFPPLFGHEIVAVLCGVVWGLWIGFAIVCAGTLIGEIGNFYAFRYCLRGRAIKMEKKNPSYACLARVVRDGGFLVAFVVRLSAIPGHFTTAVFSTCGMNIWIFSLAAFLSLPKQFITVYLGVILEQSADGTRTTRDTIISNSVLVVTFLITVVAAWWIWREMGRVRVEVFRERRAERKAKLAEAEAGRGLELDKFDPRGRSEDTSTEQSHTNLQAMMSTDRLRAASTDHLAGAPFNPRDSDDAIALGSARSGGAAQRWDNRGRAMGESEVYMGPYNSGSRYEPTIPVRAYDGNSDAYGGLEGYAPYDPYAAPDNVPSQAPQTTRYPPQAQSSRSPAPQLAREPSLSPPNQPMHPTLDQRPAQMLSPAQPRYELFDRPVPHHQQESTTGSYHTAYDGR